MRRCALIKQWSGITCVRIPTASRLRLHSPIRRGGAGEPTLPIRGSRTRRTFIVSNRRYRNYTGGARQGQNSATLAFLKFHLAALDGDIASIAATQPEVINGFPEPEQDWCRVLAAVSCLEVREQGFSEDELRTLLPLTRDSKRALILIARKARNAGFESLSTEVYDKASSLVTPDSDYAGRTTVAREAAVRRDWNNVVALLDGYVSVEDDSEELDMLALAFANITPPRARGVEFYKTLTPRLLKQHRYALFAGTLNYNRGALELAEKDFRQAFEASPRLLDGILALAQTYLRAENGEATQNYWRQ